MLSWLQHRWTGVGLLLMGLGALVLFMYGFFPLKYNSGKFAHMDDLPNFIDGVSIDGHEVYNAGEHSIVLMVIDGLRYDFVTEEYMPYAGQLLKNKSACIYVSVAEPPTVTMPRIKAMMTGSVSTFADVALNFGAPAVRGDSVLRVAASRHKRSILYGDDTWLRLFPGLWHDYDGTTSFYVTDYTEVDNNVTRHLNKVLKADENRKPNFDFLVLHYLGLDHIGHLEGARSPKIKPKLLEMDGIVKKIFEAMQLWDRAGILIVCGDHGMRDAGGHGGATPAEVLVPLLVAKSRDFTCPHPTGPGPTVAQVDLAPTLAWLLNAPIPGDSTGRILPCMMPADTRQHLYLLHLVAGHNAKMSSLPTDREFYKQFVRAEKQFAQYLSTGQRSAAKIAKDFYEESLEVMAEHLAETNVNFDMFAIGTAILLMFFLEREGRTNKHTFAFIILVGGQRSATKKAKDFYEESLEVMSEHLAETNVNFDMFAIGTAILFIFFITTSLICVTLYSLQPDNERKPLILKKTNAGSVLAFLIIFAIVCSTLTIACFITETKSQLCSFDSLWFVAFLSIACSLSMAYFIIKTGLEKTRNLTTLKDLNAVDYLLIIGTLFHAWSFFGTSFIEEEHMTWYFLWNTLMFFVLMKTVVVLIVYLSKKFVGATEVQEKMELANKMMAINFKILPKWVLLIALHRYLRTMNQTGDRWLFLPDTADWLNAPENYIYLQLHLVIGTLLTLAICLYNVRYMNNVMKMHTYLTVAATMCILFYRMTTGDLPTPFKDILEWDPVIIVDFFWAILTLQGLFEIATYVGFFKVCGVNPRIENDNKFVYNKPKAKMEDYFCEEMQEPWNICDVKLNLAKSLSHIMLNDLMLIVVLLMRPHNVIMVPSIYITCILTSVCMDHKLLDAGSKKNTEIVDVLSRTLVHLWIGYVFYFYQGNSNSLASVDLGSGYVGLRSYSAWRVALRMGLHAYAAPSIAGAMLYARIAHQAKHWQEYLQTIWRATNLYACHRMYCVSIYCVVAAVFRHHLYVWTVFSPKLLYDFVATVFSLQALVTIANIVIVTHVTSFLAKTITYKTRL